MKLKESLDSIIMNYCSRFQLKAERIRYLVPDGTRINRDRFKFRVMDLIGYQNMNQILNVLAIMFSSNEYKT